MINSIKKDFLRGLKTIKFWTEIISERIKIEINVIKITAEINTLAEKRDEFLREIGKEVCENSKTDTGENQKITTLIRKVRELEAEIEDKRKKLTELEEISRWRF